VTDYPVIMSAPMVLATLREIKESGTGKTETRRLAWRPARKGEATGEGSRLSYEVPEGSVIGTVTKHERPSAWQRVKTGDRLWVRENFSGAHDCTGIPPKDWDHEGPIWYWADGNPEDGDWTKPKPSIHLPRQFSRLTLIVASTKIERLQDITEAAARAEGAEPRMAGVGFNGVPAKTYRTGFVHLWGSLHGTDSWLSNPWVVVVSFRPILANIDSEKAAA
jgi:hypothetical protein